MSMSELSLIKREVTSKNIRENVTELVEAIRYSPRSEHHYDAVYDLSELEALDSLYSTSTPDGSGSVYDVSQIYSVTDWFYNVLQDAGYPCCEAFGLKLWGRFIFGQPIEDDGIIEEVAISTLNQRYGNSP